MSTTSGTRSGVGLRGVWVYALNASGYPNATSTSVYEGLQLTGARVLNLDDPEPRQIVHYGDDNVFALDSLSPTDAVTGELKVSKVNDTIDALFTGQASFTVGEAKLFGIGTNKRGSEAQVGMLVYRQSLDTDPDSSTFGARRWELRILPRVRVVPIAGNFDDNAEEVSYKLFPALVTKHLWGASFSESTEGFVRAQVLRGMTEYPPRIVAWQGDGSTTTFNFPSDAQAATTDKIVVWVDGTEQTTGITKAVTGLTFTSAPSSGAMIVAFYEVED